MGIPIASDLARLTHSISRWAYMPNGVNPYVAFRYTGVSCFATPFRSEVFRLSDYMGCHVSLRPFMIYLTN